MPDAYSHREKNVVDAYSNGDFLTFSSQTGADAYCVPPKIDGAMLKQFPTLVQFPLTWDVVDAYSDRRQSPSDE